MPTLVITLEGLARRHLGYGVKDEHYDKVGEALLWTLEKGLGDEAGCETVMHQIVGIRGAVAGLMGEVVEDHVRNHLIAPQKNAVSLDTKAAEQLIDVMHTYLK